MVSDKKRAFFGSVWHNELKQLNKHACVAVVVKPPVTVIISGRLHFASFPLNLSFKFVRYVTYRYCLHGLLNRMVFHKYIPYMRHNAEKRAKHSSSTNNVGEPKKIDSFESSFFFFSLFLFFSRYNSLLFRFAITNRRQNCRSETIVTSNKCFAFCPKDQCCSAVYIIFVTLAGIPKPQIKI